MARINTSAYSKYLTQLQKQNISSKKYQKNTTGTTSKTDTSNTNKSKSQAVANTTKSSTTPTTNKLIQSSVKLQSAADLLTGSVTNDIYSNAKKNGNMYEIEYQIKNMIDGYNDTITALDDNSSALGNAYKELFNSAAEYNEDKLKKVGIVIGTDNKMTFDETTFKKASIDDIKNSFDENREFTKRASNIAVNVTKYLVSNNNAAISNKKTTSTKTNSTSTQKNTINNKSTPARRSTSYRRTKFGRFAGRWTK